jgi:protein-S-isoprenylcysteine O-methyltransferase Ste14
MIVWVRFTTLATLITLAWCLSEILLGIITHSKKDISDKLDKSSLLLIWLTIIPCLVLGIYLGLHGIGFVMAGSLATSMVGLVFVFLGLVIRWTAILTLRKFFTSNVSIQNSHRLIDRGIYKLVRHPAYTGSLLSFLGLGLTFSNWLSTLIIFVPVSAAFLYRITVEEQALIRFFGDEYLRYCERTKRLIPKIY